MFSGCPSSAFPTSDPEEGLGGLGRRVLAKPPGQEQVQGVLEVSAGHGGAHRAPRQAQALVEVRQDPVHTDGETVHAAAAAAPGRLLLPDVRGGFHGLDGAREFLRGRFRDRPSPAHSLGQCTAAPDSQCIPTAFPDVTGSLRS